MYKKKVARHTTVVVPRVTLFDVNVYLLTYLKRISVVQYCISDQK